MSTINVLGFSGSLRKGSFNTALLRTAISLKPAEMNIDVATIGDLPLYNGDNDLPDAPAPVLRLRQQCKAADAFLFVTPEYNFSVTGVLKNAIDWVSRPNKVTGDSGFLAKPYAVMGASGGPVGTARAQYHLRQMCVFLNMYPVNKPEVFVGSAQQKFDDALNLKDETAKDLIKQLLTNLDTWTRKLKV